MLVKEMRRFQRRNVSFVYSVGRSDLTAIECVAFGNGFCVNVLLKKHISNSEIAEGDSFVSSRSPRPAGIVVPKYNDKIVPTLKASH